jgi:hypothetical protein
MRKKQQTIFVKVRKCLFLSRNVFQLFSPKNNSYMATFKFILHRRPRKADGTYNVEDEMRNKEMLIFIDL